MYLPSIDTPHYPPGDARTTHTHPTLPLPPSLTPHPSPSHVQDKDAQSSHSPLPLPFFLPFFLYSLRICRTSTPDPSPIPMHPQAPPSPSSSSNTFNNAFYMISLHLMFIRWLTHRRPTSTTTFTAISSANTLADISYTLLKPRLAAPPPSHTLKRTSPTPT